MGTTRHTTTSEAPPKGTTRISFPEDTYLWDAARDLIYIPVPKVACSSIKIWFLMNSPDLGIEPDPETWNANKFLRLDGHRYLLKDVTLLEGDRNFCFAFVRNPWSRLVSAYLNRIVSRAYEYRMLMKKLSRGPWYRLDKRLGYYARKHTKGQGWPESAEVTFRKFVEREVACTAPMDMDPHWRPQHCFLGGHEVDFLGRFESLREDLETLKGRIGGTVDLPRRNDSRYAADEDGACAADCPQAELRALPAMPHWRRFYARDLVETVGRVYSVDVERFGYDF